MDGNVEPALNRSPEQLSAHAAGRGWLEAAFVFIALHVVLAWLAREIGVLTGQDDVEYMVLAQSLRQGTYRELFHTGAPFHYQYPPGYPALLALWSAMAGTSFDRLVALNIVLSAGSLVLLFAALRSTFDARLAALAVGVLAVNPALVRPAGAIMSEPAYLFLSLLALYLVVRSRDRTRWLVTAGVVAILAALTRTAGLTLVAALAVNWLLERRWKLVAVPAVTGAVMLGGWLIWSGLDDDLRPGFSYVAELRSLWSGGGGALPLLERMPRYATAYITDFIPASLAMPTVAGTLIDNVAGVLLCGVSLAAGCVLLYRRWRPAALYLGAYALLLAVWLWAVGRYLVPAVPLLVVAVLAGAGALAARLRERLRLPVTLVFALVLGLGGAFRTGALVTERRPCQHDAPWPDPACLTEDQRSYFEALRWIDATLPPDAVVLTAKAGALWHYTDRLAVRYAEATAQRADAFVPWLRTKRANWIVLGNLLFEDAGDLADLIRANCDQIRIEAAFPPRTWVFRVAGDVTPAETAATCAVVDEFVRTVRGRAG